MSTPQVAAVPASERDIYIKKKAIMRCSASHLVPNIAPFSTAGSLLQGSKCNPEYNRQESANSKIPGTDNP